MPFKGPPKIKALLQVLEHPEMDTWSGKVQPPAPPYLWIQCMDAQVRVSTTPIRRQGCPCYDPTCCRAMRLLSASQRPVSWGQNMGVLTGHAGLGWHCRQLCSSAMLGSADQTWQTQSQHLNTTILDTWEELLTSCLVAQKDPDCPALMLNNGLSGRNGTMFGMGQDFARLELLMREDTFDKAAAKLALLAAD